MIFSIIVRSLFIQALWNYERIQNVGFLFMIKKGLMKTAGTQEDRKERLMRHLEFFNTNPYMAPMVGALVMREEERSRSGSEISSMKMTVSGPLAALGDSFFWGCWRPLTALFAAYGIMFFAPSWHGRWMFPYLFLIIYNVIPWYFRIAGTVIAYRSGTEVFTMVERHRLPQKVEFMRIIGFAVSIAGIVYCFAIPGRDCGTGIVMMGSFLVFLFLIKKHFTIIHIFYAILAGSLIYSILLH